MVLASRADDLFPEVSVREAIVTGGVAAQGFLAAFSRFRAGHPPGSDNARPASRGQEHPYLGYILGGRHGVHDGHSSCVMLPHVLRWNEKTTADRR
jgi:hypothetical protein